ncbi:MAG: hypothetical protein AB7K36_28475 [Chloroflexota bacterium]
MRFTSFFESWLISDGNYPELERGQLVNLAFSVSPMSVRAAGSEATAFEPRDDGSCRIIGKVSWIEPPYRTSVWHLATDTTTEVDGKQIVAIDAGTFRCYIEDDGEPLAEPAANWPLGTTLEIVGDIYVDYYVWSERIVRDHPDAPDIFFPLRVERIRFGRFKEQYVEVDANGAPVVRDGVYAQLADVDDLASYDIAEVPSMRIADLPPGNPHLKYYQPTIFLLDLSDRDLPDGEIPRTFLD